MEAIRTLVLRHYSSWDYRKHMDNHQNDDQRLKLLESVVTNTTDPVMITEAEPFDEPGPRIIYVNEAFSQMTGYSAEEVIGKSPRFLQGPKTDKKELERIGKCLRSWTPCETTLINYKKNGEEFWINFTLNPVADDTGWFTHWISIDRDVTEKKKLEELLDKVSSLAQIGGWEIDRVRDKVYWSKITKDIYELPEDYETDLVTGLSFYKEEHDRKIIIGLIDAAVTDGVKFDYELEIITAKQNVKWIRVIGEPEFKNGLCTRVYGSFQDVTARRTAEIAAKYALEERNVILESIGDAFFAVDKNWVVTYWNNMAEKVLGKTKAEMLGHVLWKVFSDSISSGSFESYHMAVSSGKAVHFEDYYPPLKKWYEISAYPSDNGLSVYFKDITDRKFSQTLLTASEKRYSELFQLSPLPKWVFSLSTFEFLDVNEAAIRYYGYSRKEFLEMTIRDICPVSEKEELEKSLFKYQQDKRSVIREVIRHQKKNGNEIQVDVQSNYIEYQGKDARIAVASDITERLKYISAIEAQNRKLKEISWLQSHGVRAPLARILGLIPLIDQEDQTLEEKSEMLQLMLLSARELDQVIIDITNKTEIIDPERDSTD